VKTGRARTSEANRRAPRLPAHFAGLTPDVAFFIERTTPIEPAALDRWKALEGEGWDVTALVDEQATTMVGLGCRYRPALKASA
jgi:hypothetical protein